MKKFLASNGTFVVAIFLLWRTGLLLIGFLAQNWLAFKHSFPYADTILVPTGLPQWLWSWGNFDGVHYLTLAASGYDGFGTQVFFPLYPMLGHFTAPFVTLFLVSNISVLLAGILLFKLVKKHFDENTAKWSVLFLFAFPASLFFGAVYTESLFLLLLLLSFWKTGFLAGIFSAFASGSRLIGFFVGPSLVLGKKKNWWGLLSVFGLGSYILYLWWRFGRPLFFLSAQSAFGSRATSVTSLVTPFQTIYRYLKIFVTVNPGSYDFWIAVSEFLAFGLGFWLLSWLTLNKKMPREWLIFSWVAFIIPSLSGTLSSMPRYLITIFPVYIGLALIKNKYLKLAILFASVMLLGLFTALFTRGYWVS